MEPEVAIHPLGPTPGIARMLPSVLPRTEHCEMHVHVGIFFDGTGNNKDWDDADDCHVGQGTQTERRKDSNVARLFYAYPDTPDEGYFRLYVSGVGTPFVPIGEETPALMGMASGAGGDGRINLALLHVLNSIQLSAYPTNLPPFSESLARALCRNGKRRLVHTRHGSHMTPLADPQVDGAALRSVGMEGKGGLLMDNLGTDRLQASTFYRREANKIAERLSRATKPRPVEVFIDVFGFSRGAAEARVFCNWLSEIFEGNTLCGLPAHIRFLGIFDTVASVGLPNSVGASGHMSWAQTAWLRIPERVHNCVHFVAMHENRPSFPLDRVWVHNGLPANCREYAFPGMHSDVGGGYGVREQGRGHLADDKDTESHEKLSQIPLNCMLGAAKAAGVPLDIDLVIQQNPALGAYDPYKIDDQLQAAYEAFHKACVPASRQPADWLLTYLAWRCQVCDRYGELPWAQRALASDRDDLEGANEILKLDLRVLEMNVLEVAWDGLRRSSPLSRLTPDLPDPAIERLRKMAPEARALWQRIEAHAPVPEPLATLFAVYAHDSYAGFRPMDHKFNTYIAGCRDLLPGSWEPEGYLRYRRFYTGHDQARTYRIVLPEYVREAQALQNTVNIRGYGIGDVFKGGMR